MIGIIGNTQGVKIAAESEAERHQQEARKTLVAAALWLAAPMPSGRLRWPGELGVAGRDRRTAAAVCAGSTVDLGGQRRLPRKALVVGAGLIADEQRDLDLALRQLLARRS